MDLSSKLLDVAYIQRERFKICRQKVDGGELFRRWFDHAAGSRVPRGVKALRDRLSLDLQEGIGEVDVDPQRLEELLDILVENAAKFSPADEKMEVRVRKDGDQLLVEVADRGCGIPPESRERIFERFFQVEDARYHSAEGMGIGLHIARKIVEEHQGRIWCEPREGGGSVFRFTMRV